MKLKLSSPWVEYQKKLKVLFDRDPDITISDVEESENPEYHYVIHIEVRKHEKYLALDRTLDKIKTFGNVTLGIYIYDVENATQGDTRIELYRALFDGNPVVRDVQETTDVTGTKHGFVRFEPEVLQFFDDNLADMYGLWSGLAQDIAQEVFAQEAAGVFFCTAPKGAPDGE